MLELALVRACGTCCALHAVHAHFPSRAVFSSITSIGRSCSDVYIHAHPLVFTVRAVEIVLPHRSVPARVPVQREERVFKSKFVFKDISGISYKKTPAVMVDYDGKARALTPQEVAYRTWTSKFTVVKRAELAGVPAPRK
jgi:hypothetical protein